MRTPKPIDVLYLFEHRDRELDTAAAVTALLRRRYGRSVVVASSLASSYRSLYEYRPKLLIVPYCYSQDSYPIRIFRETFGFEMKYVNLCFEQILSSFFQGAKTPRDSFVREEVYHLAWNLDYQQWLIGHGVKSGGVIVSGSPQHTFYRPEYRPLSKSKQSLAHESGLELELDWVLFPMQYAGAFFTDEYRRARIKAGFPENLMGEYIQFCKDSLNIVLDWIVSVAEMFPDKEFIIRPRPSPTEGEREYQELILRNRTSIPSNIKVIKSHPIRDWILSSAVVFSSFSTTLLDAILATTPSFSLTPTPVPTYLETEWNAKIPKVTSKEDFIAAVSNPTWQPGHSRLSSYVDEVYGADLGDPIKAIASTVDDLIDDTSPVASYGHNRQNLATAMKMQSKHVSSTVREFLTRRFPHIFRGGVGGYESITKSAIEAAIAEADRFYSTEYIGTMPLNEQ